MSDRTTRPTEASVEEFLDAVDHEGRRRDAQAAVELMREVTGAEPVLWGSMVGFGHQPYTTADGKQHEWFAVGLAPRKASLTLDGLTFYGSNEDLLAELDTDVLRSLVRRAWERNHHPE